jgi:hypothetical protein
LFSASPARSFHFSGTASTPDFLLLLRLPPQKLDRSLRIFAPQETPAALLFRKDIP